MSEERRQFLIEFLAETGAAVKEILELNLTLSALPATALWLGTAFEDSMVNVSAAVTHAGGSVDELSASFHEAGYAAGPMLKAAEDAAQSGITGTENLRAWAQASREFGTVTGQSTEQASGGITRMANVMGYTVEQVKDLTSAMFVLHRNTGVSSDELETVITRLGTAGRAAGVSAPTIMAVASSMQQHGIRARQAIGPMSQILEQMKPMYGGGVAMASAFGMGAEALKEFSAASPDKKLALIIAQVSKLPREQAKAMLGTYGLHGAMAENFLAMSADNKKLTTNINEATAALKDHSAMEAEVEARHHSFSGSMHLLKEKMTALGESVGIMLLPALHGMVSVLGVLARGLSLIPKPILASIAGVSLLVGAWLTLKKTWLSFILPAIGNVAGALLGINGPIFASTVATMGFTGALSALWAVLWPIALAAIAVGIAFGGWYYVAKKVGAWWKENGTTVKFFKDVWHGLVEDFHHAKDALQPIINSFMMLIDVLKPLKSLLYLALIPILGPLIPIVQSLVAAFFFLKGVFKAIAAVGPYVFGPLSEILNEIRMAVKPILDVFMDLKKQVADALEEIGINSVFFMDILKSLGTVVKWLAVAVFAPVIAVLGIVLGVVWLLAKAVGWVTKQFKRLSDNVGPLAAILMLPFLPIIIPIMWVIDLVSWLWDKLKGVWAAIVSAKGTIVSALKAMFSPIWVVIDAVAKLVSKWAELKKVAADAISPPEPPAPPKSGWEKAWDWAKTGARVSAAVGSLGMTEMPGLFAKAGKAAWGFKKVLFGSSFMHISEGIHEILPSLEKLNASFRGVQHAAVGLDIERKLPGRPGLANAAAPAHPAPTGPAHADRAKNVTAARISVPVTVELDGMILARVVAEHLVEIGHERNFNEPTFPLRGIEPV